MEKKMPRLRNDTQILLDKARGCSARNGLLHFDQNPKLKYPNNATCVRPNSARVRSLRRDVFAAKKVRPQKKKREPSEWAQSVAEARVEYEAEQRRKSKDPKNYKLGFVPMKKDGRWYKLAKEIYQNKQDDAAGEFRWTENSPSVRL